MLDAHVQHLQREADDLQESLEKLHVCSSISPPLVSGWNKVPVGSPIEYVTETTSSQGQLLQGPRR